MCVLLIDPTKVFSEKIVSKAKPAPSAAADGFTLLEILVALAILAMSLTVLLSTFSLALDRTSASKTRDQAQALAKTLLLQAEVAPPAELGDRTGENQTMRWRLHVSPYGTTEERAAWRTQPAEVVVTVWWDDHGRTRALSLQSLTTLSGEHRG
jgi:general secretion pathway protein I